MQERLRRSGFAQRAGKIILRRRSPAYLAAAAGPLVGPPEDKGIPSGGGRAGLRLEGRAGGPQGAGRTGGRAERPSEGFPPTAGLPGRDAEAHRANGRAGRREGGLSGRSGLKERARPGREGGRNPWSGQAGSARGLWRASGPEECHCERKRSKSGVRPLGAGGGCGRGRRGKRAGLPPAAPVRCGRREGSLSGLEALWAGAWEAQPARGGRGGGRRERWLSLGGLGDGRAAGREGRAGASRLAGRARGRPNLRIEPIAPSALRLIRDPLGWLLATSVSVGGVKWG